AKIHDAAYYPTSEDDVRIYHPDEGSYADCTTRTDMNYANESAAYEMIARSTEPGIVDGTLKYFGSWTCLIPCPGSEEGRWVRLILLEKLDGATHMPKVIRQGKQEPSNRPSKTERLDVLKQMISIFDIFLKKDGTPVIINFDYAALYTFFREQEYYNDHPRARVEDPISEEDLAKLFRYSPILCHWPEPLSMRTKVWDIGRTKKQWGEWLPKSYRKK
ncbi:hypothetical protein QBC35DRAFT_548642, partial [Podospora australis]